MTIDLIWALVAFAFATSITPGPNNILLLSSGVNFGLPRTLPHMLGITLGFSFMLMVVSFGLGQFILSNRFLHGSLNLFSAAYLLWLAWKVARSTPIEGSAARANPMTFLQAAAFQWVNPKAWYIAVAAAAAYANPDQQIASTLTMSVVYGLVNFPSIMCWAAFGSTMRRFLARPAMLAAFNWTMSALLVLSLWPIIRGIV